MNKSQLREFAIRSRVALIGSVKLRAFAYGITQDKVKENKVTPSEQALGTNGKPLTVAERLQRDELLRQIAQKGFMQVMEEVAYTWFNRFIALRYMENAQLLPIAQRVFVRKDEVRPEILADALHVSLPSLDMQRVIAMLECNENEPLYKLLLLTLCGNLHDILPQMFEKISDYTELLFPDGLLQKDSVLAEMAKLDEDAWQSIQVVGWLYQYYNTELKAETFALLKENVKITKERIGAATQLFTPEWIVRYMVENSLGRLWLEGHRNDTLQGGWKYYLPEAEQEPNVAARLAELRKDAAKLQPEEITVIDPCMGSGHILVAAFDVLMDIYRTAGYTDRDAVPSIIGHNLYGLDIDDRAAQLAYFAVMMKACEYDHRYLSRSEMPQPHVCAIAESNTLSAFDSLQGQISLDALCVQTANDLIRTFHDAKEYGSILDVQIASLDSAEQLMEQLHAISQSNFELNGWLIRAEDLLPKLAMQAEIMQRKYDVVVTNPPYMGSGGMGVKLAEFVKDEYPDSKSDLFAVFIEKCGKMLSDRGYQAMITQHAWMFLSSFEKLRSKLQQRELVNMAHLGARAFEEIGGEVVQTTSFVMQKVHMKGFKGVYCRLIEPTTQQGKEDMFLAGEGRFVACQDEFAKIPGAPVAYWASEVMLNGFLYGTPLNSYEPVRKGLTTADNERFLRLWYEVDMTAVGAKWIFTQKGGEYRKWYGNIDEVVNWENNGYEIKHFVDNNGKLRSVIRNEDFYFKACVSWTDVSSSKTSFRYVPKGCISNASGPSFYPEESTLYYLLGMCNTVVAENVFKIICPTIHFEIGQVSTFPVIVSSSHTIDALVQNSISLSRADWDSFETSWDFKRHPLLCYGISIYSGLGDGKDPPTSNLAVQLDETSNLIVETNAPKAFHLQLCFEMWLEACDQRFAHLKQNEEELNRIFIDIYGLQDELTPEVADKDVTVRRADLARDIRSLISYAIGCMMGRYSLDVEGLAYAGGEWDWGKYSTFLPDKDGILPIADDEYFGDDIVNRFIQFIEVVYGAKTLEDNLRFIADVLGGAGKPPKDVIRSYFLKNFYKDHLKVYQKRPIYWLFDSGNQNGFKALIYLHRYDRDTLARLRTDYVHPQQERLRTQINGAQHLLNSGDVCQRSIAAKRLDKLQKQLTELGKYEEQLHHLADERITLDLDDGVKVNYAKMDGLVAAIK